MPSKPEPESYAALAGDAYRSFVGVAEAVNHQSLDYVRTLFGIFAKPYESVAVRALAKEQIARSAAVISATIESLEATNGHAAEFAREMADIVTSAHQTYVEALRGIAETSASNAAFASRAVARRTSLQLPIPSVN